MQVFTLETNTNYRQALGRKEKKIIIINSINSVKIFSLSEKNKISVFTINKNSVI
jgi:hypothetical protein